MERAARNVVCPPPFKGDKVTHHLLNAGGVQDAVYCSSIYHLWGRLFCFVCFCLGVNKLLVLKVIDLHCCLNLIKGCSGCCACGF